MGRSAYQQRRVGERRRGLAAYAGHALAESRSDAICRSRRPAVLAAARAASGSIPTCGFAQPPTGSLLFGSSPIGSCAVRIGRTPGWRVEYCARGAACLVAAEIDDVVAVGACKFVKLLRPSKRCSAKVTMEIRHVPKWNDSLGASGTATGKGVGFWSAMNLSLKGDRMCNGQPRVRGAKNRFRRASEADRPGEAGVPAPNRLAIGAYIRTDRSPARAVRAP